MMDDVILVLLAVASLLGLLAAVSLYRRDQRAVATAAGPAESEFAVSTEGMKRCPACGMGNLVSDSTCSSCRRRLPG
jgi:hypothetical protein